MGKKTLYFVEKTKKIEGTYVEIDTIEVTESKSRAITVYQKYVKQGTSKQSGYVLNECVVSGDDDLLKKLIDSAKSFPDAIYRKIQILSFFPVAEYQAI